MNTRYIHRSIEPMLKHAAEQLSLITHTGPRQSDETTPLRELFNRIHRFVFMELLNIRSAVEFYRHGFLPAYSTQVIFPIE